LETFGVTLGFAPFWGPFDTVAILALWEGPFSWVSQFCCVEFDGLQVTSGTYLFLGFASGIVGYLGSLGCCSSPQFWTQVCALVLVSSSFCFFFGWIIFPVLLLVSVSSKHLFNIACRREVCECSDLCVTLSIFAGGEQCGPKTIVVLIDPTC